MIRGPALFQPEGRYHQPWSGHVVAVTAGAHPTVDYYVASRMAGAGRGLFHRVDASAAPDASAPTLPDGAFVVVARHASPAWLDRLTRQAGRLAGVAYLMDDDIPAAWHCGDVPRDYGIWTTARYLRIRARLARLCDRVWFSTEALRARYPQVPGQVVPPLDFGEPGPCADPGCRRWGYHGTRVHRHEPAWLVPVVRRVHEAVPDAEFEIFGDARTRRLFKGISRVHVLAPRSWAGYLDHCRTTPLAVGLAPLLPGPFNAVRAHVKAYDILRCGAVGVYSARPPYQGRLEGAGAALLPDDADAWADEVVALLQDPRLRQVRHQDARLWREAESRKNDMAEFFRPLVGVA